MKLVIQYGKKSSAQAEMVVGYLNKNGLGYKLTDVMPYEPLIPKKLDGLLLIILIDEETTKDRVSMDIIQDYLANAAKNQNSYVLLIFINVQSSFFSCDNLYNVQRINVGEFMDAETVENQLMLYIGIYNKFCDNFDRNHKPYVNRKKIVMDQLQVIENDKKLSIKTYKTKLLLQCILCTFCCLIVILWLFLASRNPIEMNTVMIISAIVLFLISICGIVFSSNLIKANIHKLSRTEVSLNYLYADKARIEFAMSSEPDDLEMLIKKYAENNDDFYTDQVSKVVNQHFSNNIV